MYFVHPQLQFKNILALLKPTSEEKLKHKLSKFFPNFNFVFTDLGRSAFQIAVKELDLEKSEMLVPAYICDIFLPIFEHYNIKPIYLDIDLKTFNIKLSEIETKITPQTKSILVCHTYGLPNDMDKILEIAKKYNLKIIEDCAHCFPSSTSGQVGECAFFSLSKIMPTINGGLLVCKNSIKTELKRYKFRLRNIIKFLRLFPCLAKISEKFRSGEKTLATKKLSIPRQASKQSLKILNWYLDNFEEQISKRKEVAEYFHKKLQEIGFQSSGITYVSALVPKNIDRDNLFNKLRKKNIFCSRIWHDPLFKDLPNTLEASKRIINFPLQDWFGKKDIDKIISCIL